MGCISSHSDKNATSHDMNKSCVNVSSSSQILDQYPMFLKFQNETMINDEIVILLPKYEDKSDTGFGFIGTDRSIKPNVIKGLGPAAVKTFIDAT